MKAIRIHSYGAETVYEDAPLPSVGEQDVLVRVQASAVNPVDNAFRAGYMAGYFPLTLPAVLGCDVAGVVEKVGAQAGPFKTGDAVYGRTNLNRLGGFAEYAVLTASELALKPAALDFQQAAALPHTTLTAWRALVDTAGLQPGQRLLILGASGGVGVAAVQLAKHLGARVTGVASAANLGLVRELGADEAINYANGGIPDSLRDIDVVLDGAGGEALERAWKTLRPGGILVSLVQNPSAETAAAHGVRAAMGGGMPPAGPVLSEVGKLADAGKLRPVISSVLPLNETARGLEMIASRHTRGKIVIQIA
jgi:NADPH:quinone reductase-like Zn-dependent oxidoreductase